jgi:hypothetical protein
MRYGWRLATVFSLSPREQHGMAFGLNHQHVQAQSSGDDSENMIAAAA